MKKILVLLLLTALALPGLLGCPLQQKTATQQIASQTTDPQMLALASYVDALEAYVAAQELYLPYQATIREAHPEVDAQVLKSFRAAREILNAWKLAGSVSTQDRNALREALRDISLAAAKQIGGDK